MYLESAEGNHVILLWPTSSADWSQEGRILEKNICFPLKRGIDEISVILHPISSPEYR